MMLFAALVKQNRSNAWKSLRHEDGELCFGGGWFIVGIDTPEGSYTYHYEDKYFDVFDCEELERGKPWDGHSEKDVTRLLSLTQQPKTGRWIGLIEHCESIGAIPSGLGAYYWCSSCDYAVDAKVWSRNYFNFCPNCGSKMIEPKEGDET
jgi:hypothetical protein